MGNLIINILIGVALVESVVLVSLNTKHPSQNVLAEATVQTQSPTPTNAPTQPPTPEPTVEPTPTIKPTPTPTPQPTYSSQEINEFIDSYASSYNVSPHILRYIALCESGFNPAAVKLSYFGLYQFGKLTWESTRKNMSEDPDANLRLNAKEAVKTAAYVLQQNKAYIWPNCIPK